jgi:hypothetical protein
LLRQQHKRGASVADYLPGPDANYSAWVANFVTYANANLAALGLTAADLTPVTTAQTTWNAGFAAHIAAKQAAIGAKQAKDENRAALTGVIRPLVRRLQASSQVSDLERGALGITVRQAPTPIGPPTSAPAVGIECGNRLQHTIKFYDSTSESQRGKPAGVLGVEIWNKVGTTPPVGENDLRFIAIDTDAPYVLNFDAVDGGKTAYYWLRWVNPTGERGPWSEPSQATIAA